MKANEINEMLGSLMKSPYLDDSPRGALDTMDINMAIRFAQGAVSKIFDELETVTKKDSLGTNYQACPKCGCPNFRYYCEYCGQKVKKGCGDKDKLNEQFKKICDIMEGIGITVAEADLAIKGIKAMML